MMFRRQSLASLLLCSLSFAVRSAHADPSAAEISAAKAAFASAVSLEGEQHWAEAELKLRQVIAVKDTPGLRFHLAHCEAEQGNLVEASLDYQRTSELLSQGAKAPDVQKLLGPASESLKQRMPQLTVEIPSDVSAPAATLDGKAYLPSELALGLPLNPGRHELRVTAAGRRSFQRAWVQKEAEQLSIKAELPLLASANAPAVPAPPPPAVTPRPISSVPADSSRSSSAKLYLMVGESVLTAAGLAVGIGYKIAQSSASDRVNSALDRIDQAEPGEGDACGDSMQAASHGLVGTCSDLLSAVDAHDRDATLSTIGFVTAGVGAAALLTTWLVYPSSDSQTSSVSLQPIAGLGRVGLFGRF